MLPREKIPRLWRPITKAQWEHVAPSPIQDIVQVGHFLLIVTVDVVYFLGPDGKQAALPIGG